MTRCDSRQSLPLIEYDILRDWCHVTLSFSDILLLFNLAYDKIVGNFVRTSMSVEIWLLDVQAFIVSIYKIFPKFSKK